MTVGRVLAVVWASPVTVAGLLGAVLAGRRPRRAGGVLLVTGARGPFAAMLRSRRKSAATLGHVVITLGEPSAALLAHEMAHVRQVERLGPLFPLVYLALLAARGYRRHPLERAARRA